MFNLLYKLNKKQQQQKKQKHPATKLILKLILWKFPKKLLRLKTIINKQWKQKQNIRYKIKINLKRK